MAKFTGHTITSDSALGSSVIQRSLIFNANDNTRLVRTIGSTSNRRTYTYSWWMKRTMQSAEQYVWYVGSSGGTPYLDARFEANSHELQLQDYTPSRPIRFITNRKFRDPNAWYHFVFAIDTTQGTASNRAKLYVNGVQETSFSTETYPDQNYDSSANVSGHIQVWGTNKEGTSNDLDGYLAEVHFIDGYQYDASYFGFTDPVTNIWSPKRYEGTYGTNGYYLDFSDNSSTAALGIDKSPNGNDFTANNFATTDSVIDTPTNNFCTLNPLDAGTITESQGNLKVTRDSAHETIQGTMSMPSGKWYWEVYNGMPGGSPDGTLIGLGSNASNILNSHVGSTATSWGYENTGLVWNNSNGTGSNASLANGDIFGIAYDADQGIIRFYKNGTLQNDGYTGITANDYMPQVSLYHSNSFLVANFGQDSSFAGNKTAQGKTDASGLGDFYYTPPTGYKALCSRNLPPNVPSVVKPQKHFECVTFTGNGSTGQSITSLEFQPDFIWFKNRSAGNNHASVNSVLGRSKGLYMDSNSGDFNSSAGRDLVSFDPSGFTVGEPEQASSTNNNGSNIVAWCWKAGGSSNTFNIDGKGYASASAAGLDDGSINPTGASVNTESGFSILTYTGTGSNATIGHGLGKAPKLIWVKLRGSQDWFVNNGMIFNDYGKYYKLNSSGSSNASDTNVFPNTAPTSTVFSVGTDNAVNGNGDNYVAYIWSEIPGFSQFGYWTGNGSSDGTYVHTGFTPRMMIYRKSSDENWHMLDTQRDPLNPNSLGIDPNLSNAEADDSNIQIDFLGSGFKMRASHGTSNADDTNYFYYVWAGQPGTTPFGTHPNAR